MKQFCFLFFLLYYFIYPPAVEAALVTVKDGGEVVVNVLSSTQENNLEKSEPVDIEIKDVVSDENDKDERITLSKENNKVSLKVGLGKELDLADWEDDIVEVEETPKTTKVRIAFENGKFVFKQKGISAFVDAPVTIDPQEDKIYLGTSSGDEYLTVLPHEAATSALRTNIINQIANKSFEVITDDGGLAYLIQGEKVFSLFDLYDIKIPISVKVSAATGEMMSIESPEWLRFVSYIFV